MTESLVSVVVATWRRETELMRALASLERQTYLSFDVLVIDDNDDPVWNQKVEAVVDQFRERLTISLIHNHPKQGSAGTRNVGIRAAKTEYITFLDDDDVYLPEKIERQLVMMQKQNADYSLTDLDLFYDNDQLSEHRRRDYIGSGASLLECHFMYHMTGTDTLMFRRDYLLKIGCFPGIDLGDEFYLMHRAIEGGGKLSYLPECVVRAYVHEGSEGLSSGESKIRCENDLYAYKQKYFSEFDRRTIRYIRMRHHAVLAFAEFRMRRFGRAAAHACCAVLCDPLACVRLLINRKR